MKISELREKRIIHRPTRNFDASGKRIYNAFEYDLPYNPIYEGNERERLFAKLIDMLLFILIFVFIFHEIVFISVVLSIPCVIISGTITESVWGTTLGKRVFRIKVLNNYRNYPGFLKSLARNLLCLVNFCPVFTDYVPPPGSVMGTEGTRMNFSMHLNNKICKTYIVKDKKIPEIKKMLEKDSV